MPDENDNHVLAAAIKSGASVIVTSNLRDFPKNQLSAFDIEAQHPDLFISNLIDLHPAQAVQAFKNQVERLKNPPLSAVQVLNSLENNGLTKYVSKIRRLLAQGQ